MCALPAPSKTNEGDVELDITAGKARNRNPRGEGSKLRDDIIEAARRLLERAGTRESVTLRAIAREIGIAAPSIYRHFADREAIVQAVEAMTYEELERAIEAATATSSDSVDRLVAGCLAYVDFSLENPGRYRILFNQLEGAPEPESVLCVDAQDLVGMKTFQLLVDGVTECIASGRSQSTDPFSDSTNIWTALHGMVTLRMTATLFPWPPLVNSVRDVVCTLARIE